MGAKNPVEKQGAIIHHLKMVIEFCRKPLAGSLMISAKVLCSNHPEEATLPLRCLATATPLWTCRPGTIARTIILGQQVLECSLQIHIFMVK